MVSIQSAYPAITAFVLIGMLLGVGLAVLGGMEDQVKVSDVINETITLASGVGTTTYDEISSVVWFGNATYYLNSSADIESSTMVNWSTSGKIITYSGNYSDANTYRVVYWYDKDTTVSTKIGQFGTAIGGFASWFPIIIIALVAAIVLGLLVKSMSGGGRE